MDEITAPPVVPGFTEPVPDFNTQSDDVFSDNAQRMVNELPPFHAGMTSMADWMNAAGQYVLQLSQLVQEGAISAEEFSLIARGYANFKGLWSGLTGAQVVGITVEHNNKVWVSRQAMSAIQNEEPGVSPVWRDTSVDGGVLVVTGPNDVRPDRVTNTAWNFYRAVFSSPAVDVRESAVSVDILGAGGVSDGSNVVADYRNGVMPGAGTYIVSTHRMLGSWRVQYAVLLYADAGLDRAWFRTGGGGTFDGRVWMPLSGGGGSSGPTTSEPVVTLPVPVRSAEYLVGGAIRGVDITIDCAAANVFRGYTTNLPAHIPAGEEAPLGLSGTYGFRHNFVLENLPEDGSETQIKYLRWGGFLRAGSGGGILMFTVPAGWNFVWAAGMSGTSTPPALFNGNGSPAGASEEIQLVINASNKRVTAAWGGWV